MYCYGSIFHASKFKSNSAPPRDNGEMISDKERCVSSQGMYFVAYPVSILILYHLCTAEFSCLWCFLYSNVLDTCANSSRRHISGSDSIQTNNSQVPLTKSYGGDNTVSLENKRRFSSLFPMESLMFLSIMGYSNQRYNGTNQVMNTIVVFRHTDFTITKDCIRFQL